MNKTNFAEPKFIE